MDSLSGTRSGPVMRATNVGALVGLLLLGSGAVAQTHWERAPQLLGRVFAGVVYDAARAEVVLFGGRSHYYSGDRLLDDTWVGSGQQWQRRTPLHHPSPRAVPALCFDAARSRVLLFGGYPGFRDTWEWDGLDWNQRSPATVPQVQDFGVMADDPVRGRCVLLAPALPGSRSETWEWNGSDWQQRTSPSAPFNPNGVMIAFEPVLGRVLVHGGLGVAGTARETWDWDGGQWNLRTVTGPIAFDTNIAWDPATQRTVLVAAALGGAQMWAYDRQNWSQIAAVAVPNRTAVWPVTDVARGRVVQFGGIDALLEHSDTLEWDGAQWTQTIADQVPSIFQLRVAYAPALDRLVAIGVGDGGMAMYVGDEQQWTEVPLAGGPQPRSELVLAADWRSGGVLMFGGFALAGGTPLTDTWLWTGGAWRQQFPPHVPPGLSAVAADPGTGNILALGATATWEWDGTDWLPHGAPPPLSNTEMAYDSDRSRHVLFGATAARVAQTWEWDGAVWTRVPSLHLPSVRFGHGMAYDAARRRVVLHGGDTGSIALPDTWEWDGVDWTQRLSGAGIDVAPAGPFVLSYRPTTRTVLGVMSGSGELWSYGPQHPAAIVTFGSGCLGSAGVPQLSMSTLPWLGDSVTLRIDRVPLATSLAVVALGTSASQWNGRALPFDLGVFGMPHCFASVAPDELLLAGANAGVATAVVAIPNQPALLGIAVHAQAFVPDAGVNAFGGTVSQALTATVGAR